MKLYSAPASGNAYKVRLFLSLLGLEHELVPVDIVQALPGYAHMDGIAHING